MNTLLMAFGGLQPIVDAPLWVVLLLKITAILCAAWAAHLAIKRINPRWRVFLWRVTAVGLLALPTTAGLLPAMKIYVRQTPSIEEAAIAATPDAPPVGRTVATNDPSVLSTNPSDPSATRLYPILASDTPDMDAIGSSASPRQNALTPAAVKTSLFKWPALLLAAWLSGIAVLAFRLSIGYYRIRLVVRRAEQPAQWVRDEAARVAEAVGCRTRFELLQSANVSSPFLCGFLRPRLLLPAGMCEDSYRRDLPGIIAHELAHIRSRDVLWNFGLQLISIVLWFHPLVWRMRHAHLTACELVCDAASADFVGDVSDYCRTLARVAVDVCTPLPTTGIAMARTSAVGRRLGALKKKVFHLPLRRRSVLASGAVALLTVSVIGALQLTLAAPSEAEPTAEANTEHADKKETDNRTGRIVDSKDVGIAGATVKQVDSSWTATTDADGYFTLPELKPGDSARLTFSANGFLSWNELFWITCRANGEYRIPNDWPIQLARPTTLSGVVLGPDGKPLAGAPLSLDIWVQLNHVSSSTGNYKPTVTDQQGRFRMEQIPPGSHVIYYPEKQPNRSIPVKGVIAGLVVEPTDGQVLNNLVIDLSECTAGVEGRVFGPDGEPMTGATVCCAFYHKSGGSGPIVYTPRTDADGRYKITGICPGKWLLYPCNPQYQRSQPSHVKALSAGESAHLDLKLTEYSDSDNQITRAAAEAERTGDLSKLKPGSFTLGGLPPVDRNLDKFGQMIYLSLSPGRNGSCYVNVKPLGLPAGATPEEVALAVHCGELYFLPPDRLVTVNGTIVAPFTPPPGSSGWDSKWRNKMTRADLVKQIEASRHINPDADGRRIQVKQGEIYYVVRADGKGFLIRIGQVVDRIEISFMYLGHLRLKTAAEREMPGSAPSAKPADDDPPSPQPAKNETGTTINSILDRLAREEKRYDSLEVTANSSYRHLNRREPLVGDNFVTYLGIETNERSVFAKDRLYHEEIREIKKADGSTQSTLLRQAYDGKWTRQDRYSSSTNPNLKLNRWTTIGLNQQDDLRLLRPHTILLHDDRINGQLLSAYLVSGWYDARLRYAMTIEYVGDERIDDLYCHKLKCALPRKGKVNSFFFVWLARDRNLLPARREWHRSSIGASLPTGACYVAEFQEIRPGLWFPFKTVDIAYQKDSDLSKPNPPVQWRRDTSVKKVVLTPRVDDKLFSFMEVPKGTLVKVLDRHGERIGQYVQREAGNIEISPKMLLAMRHKAETNEDDEYDPKDASAPERKRRIDAALETLRSDPPPAQKERIEAALEILRYFRIHQTNTIKWATAIRELITIGKPAIPKLIEELDRTDHWANRRHELRALGFVLRGIGDPRVVPTLIRALPYTLQPASSDCGCSVNDRELLVFMQQHDNSRANGGNRFTFGRPINEILSALKELTGVSRIVPGKQEDQEFKDIHHIFLSRNADKNRNKHKLFLRFAERWADWWAKNWEYFVNEEGDAQLEQTRKSLDRISKMPPMQLPIDKPAADAPQAQ